MKSERSQNPYQNWHDHWKRMYFVLRWVAYIDCELASNSFNELTLLAYAYISIHIRSSSPHPRTSNSYSYLHIHLTLAIDGWKREREWVRVFSWFPFGIYWIYIFVLWLWTLYSSVYRSCNNTETNTLDNTIDSDHSSIALYAQLYMSCSTNQTFHRTPNMYNAIQAFQHFTAFFSPCLCLLLLLRFMRAVYTVKRTRMRLNEWFEFKLCDLFRIPDWIRCIFMYDIHIYTSHLIDFVPSFIAISHHILVLLSTHIQTEGSVDLLNRTQKICW